MALSAGFGPVAPYLENPLVLIGFFFFLAVGFLRLLVNRGLFPQLSRQGGTELLSRILTFGFVLAVLLVLLGFGLEAFQAWTSRPKQVDVDLLTARLIEELEASFAGNNRELTETVKAMISSDLRAFLDRVARGEVAADAGEAEALAIACLQYAARIRAGEVSDDLASVLNACAALRSVTDFEGGARIGRLADREDATAAEPARSGAGTAGGFGFAQVHRAGDAVAAGGPTAPASPPAGLAAPPSEDDVGNGTPDRSSPDPGTPPERTARLLRAESENLHPGPPVNYGVYLMHFGLTDPIPCNRVALSIREGVSLSDLEIDLRPIPWQPDLGLRLRSFRPATPASEMEVELPEQFLADVEERCREEPFDFGVVPRRLTPREDGRPQTVLVPLTRARASSEEYRFLLFYPNVMTLLTSPPAVDGTLFDDSIKPDDNYVVYSWVPSPGDPPRVRTFSVGTDTPIDGRAWDGGMAMEFEQIE